jgi:hypothetical protein
VRTPRVQTPVHPPRVPTPVHPPGVQIPRVQTPIRPTRVQTPVNPPRVPTTPKPVQKRKTTAPVWVRLSARSGKTLRSYAASRNLRPRALAQTHYYREALQHAQTLQPFEFHPHHIFDGNGKKETIDTLLAGNDNDIWDRALSNEYGRLAQGIDGRVVATDNINFINKSEVPANKTVTYGVCVCDYRPLKSEPYWVRLTVGGDKLPYDDDSGSPAASLLETKLILKSTIYDARRGASFLSADLKDHFLASPMQDPEYMKIKYK